MSQLTSTSNAHSAPPMRRPSTFSVLALAVLFLGAVAVVPQGGADAVGGACQRLSDSCPVEPGSLCQQVHMGCLIELDLAPCDAVEKVSDSCMPCADGAPTLVDGLMACVTDAAPCLTKDNDCLGPCPADYTGEVVDGKPVCVQVTCRQQPCVEPCTGQPAEDGDPLFLGTSLCSEKCASTFGNEDCLFGVRTMVDVGGVPVAIPLPDSLGDSGTDARNECHGAFADGQDTFADCPIPRSKVHGWGYYYSMGSQNGATHAGYYDSVKQKGRSWYETWDHGTVLGACTDAGGKGSYADSLSAGVSRDQSSEWCDSGPAHGITASFVN